MLGEPEGLPEIFPTAQPCSPVVQVEQFKQISPEADVRPTPLPANLLPQSWSLR